jgi:hypothetical protein
MKEREGGGCERYLVEGQMDKREEKKNETTNHFKLHYESGVEA